MSTVGSTEELQTTLAAVAATALATYRCTGSGALTRSAIEAVWREAACESGEHVVQGVAVASVEAAERCAEAQQTPEAYFIGEDLEEVVLRGGPEERDCQDGKRREDLRSAAAWVWNDGAAAYVEDDDAVAGDLRIDVDALETRQEVVIAGLTVRVARALRDEDEESAACTTDRPGDEDDPGHGGLRSQDAAEGQPHSSDERRAREKEGVAAASAALRESCQAQAAALADELGRACAEFQHERESWEQKRLEDQAEAERRCATLEARMEEATRKAAEAHERQEQEDVEAVIAAIREQEQAAADRRCAGCAAVKDRTNAILRAAADAHKKQLESVALEYATKLAKAEEAHRQEKRHTDRLTQEKDHGRAEAGGSVPQMDRGAAGYGDGAQGGEQAPPGRARQEGGPRRGAEASRGTPAGGTRRAQEAGGRASTQRRRGCGSGPKARQHSRRGGRCQGCRRNAPQGLRGRTAGAGGRAE